jgi:hypothetical protein
MRKKIYEKMNMLVVDRSAHSLEKLQEIDN